MTNLKIDFSNDRTTFRPGEEVAGTVSWSTDQPVQKLELRLFWFTRGKGTQDMGLVETARFEQPSQNETRSFRFRLPEAPYSFSGTLISVVWALELIVHPSKEVTRSEIQVGPQRREVHLEKVADPGIAQTWITITKG
jgi:hypothetical protein